MTRAVDNRVITPERTETPIVINGDMQIAQRGTSATTLALSSGGFRYNDVDRVSINAGNVSTGQISTEQIDSGLDGFPKAKRITVTTAESSPATNGFLSIQYGIEAQNLQLLKYGTSNALPITLSFYVRSSVTGTFVGNIVQVDSRPSENRVFPYNYTINSTNTWEKKVINIDADTSGVISNDNGLGFEINLTYLYIGSDYTSGTVNTWNSNASGNSYMNNPTRVNLLATNAATFDMTAVQLEVGDYNTTTLPPFQFEDRATSLARCQRYYAQFDYADGNRFAECIFRSTTRGQGNVSQSLPIMRATPSVSSSIPAYQFYYGGDTTTACTATSGSGFLVIDNFEIRTDFTLSSGSSTTGYPVKLRTNGAGALKFDAEI